MNKCKNCNFYKAIYRWEPLFWQHNSRYCVKQDKFVKPNDSCFEWEEKETICDLSEARFEELLQALNFLLEYFEEK